MKKMQFWCKLLILSVCARRALALNETELSDLAVISKDDDVRDYTTENTAVATTERYYRHSRWQRHDREGYVSEARGSHDDYQDEEASPDHPDVPTETKAMSQPKLVDYWNGYYDFLINEGSYKFWAVFQLATAALLIYSGFAALYYAKLNPPVSDDYDYFARRRRRYADWDGPPGERPFFGLRPETFQRIIDAIAEDVH